MKLNYTYLYPLLLLLAAIACRGAQKQHEVRSPVAALCHIDVDSVYAVVGDNFESHPSDALQALQSLAAQKDCPQMTRQILAQTYFNMGAIQDERLEVLDSAIYYLDKSYELIVIMKEVISFWQEQHDEVRLSIYEKDLADMTSK